MVLDFLSDRAESTKLPNSDGAAIKLACWDMRQFDFFTLSRMSLKLHTYEVLQPSRDNSGEILRS